MRRALIWVAVLTSTGALAFATGSVDLTQQVKDTLTTIDTLPTKAQLDSAFDGSAQLALANLSTIAADQASDTGIRLRAIGRLEALPAEVRRELDAVVRETRENGGLQVNLAINYSGRAEVVDAVNAILDAARAQGSLGTLQVDEEALFEQ